jgi:Zn-dependent M16 (insulinase) family peptidase
MKKLIFLVIVVVFTMGSTLTFAAKTNSDKSAVATKTENKLSEEEMNRYIKRVEEIRNMDKSEMTKAEKRVMKSELKEIKKNVKKGGGTIYIGGSTLLLIILLIILL